ncbi:fasciclin domain-containing protein [Halalkalibaculum sp. DA384]|uniref:fasciclin domain-containing protein n=1 Tax=Halalkalibaculum sp. DA384 TaxID=3373606 RepID=UPI003754B73F
MSFLTTLWSKVGAFPLLLSVALVFSLTACGSDDDDDGNGMGPDTEMNIVEQAESSDDLSTLVQAISDAGLAGTLASDGPFTVFAPTNAAFNALPEGTLSSLSSEQLADILTFHVIPGEIMSGDLQARQTVETLLGEELLITSEGGMVTINGNAVVSSADLQASNGVIHVVDGVLLPKAFREPNIVDTAEDLGNFTTLLGALDQTDLKTTIQYEGPFTVFAPTDDAFSNLPDGLLASLSDEDLAEILQYHVVGSEVMSGDLAPQQAVASLTGEELFITANGEVNVNGTSTVATADVEASNGVIHAVDQVLLPDRFQNIVENATKRYELSTLVQAVVDAELAATLSDSESEFTVFAPSNAAFEGVDLSGLSMQELADILTFHVIEGSVLSGDLESSQTVQTVQGEELLITAEEGSVTINGSAAVTTADIEGTNGVIHIIDGVLLPSDYREPNIVDQAENAGSFSTLVDALDQTGLKATLQYQGPFTVFAPTDDAFANLPDGLLASLSEEQLTEILQYHVVSADIMSGDLDTQQAVATLTGEDIFVTANGEVNVNATASVVNADIEAANGVIHAINQVLLPNKFISVAGIVGKRYDLSTLAGAVADADLVSVLSDTESEFTVFAPTNEAFEGVDLSGLSQQELADILTYHVLGSAVLSGDLSDGQTATTVNGADITISIDNDGTVSINGDAAIVQTVDLEGTNGVVHIIDGVLSPPSE